MGIGAEAGIVGKTTFVREITAVYRGASRPQFKVRGPKSAADFIREVLPDNSREHFVALYLDGAHKVIAFSIVATGSANSCPVHPREVFQAAILAGAIAIIAGHNHPSGEVIPSTDDKKITSRLKEAGSLLAISLLDHVIVGEDTFFSFADEMQL